MGRNLIEQGKIEDWVESWCRFSYLLVRSYCTFILCALERTSTFSLDKTVLAFRFPVNTVFIEFLLLGKGNTKVNKNLRT